MRFAGKIGFSEEREIEPGVYEHSPVERKYMGDIVRDYRSLNAASSVIGERRLMNTFSIVADAYLNRSLDQMIYIEYNGVKYAIASYEINPPRITIRVDRVYNGPST